MSLGFGLYSCNSTPTNAQNRVTVSQAPASDIDVKTENVPGFNVGEFANLLKTTKNPSDIEKAINADGNKINNLDLDKNDTIDYLTVVEGKDNTITVVDQTISSASVTLATLTINQQNQTMQIAGNQQYCGDNYNYQSQFTVGDYLFMAYLLHPHPYYYTPYHYGFYPGYYHPYRSFYGYGYRQPYYRQTYSRNVRTNTVVNRSYNNTSVKGGGVRSGGTSNVRAAAPTQQQRTSISNATQSQRSFQTRNTAAPVRSGGFGSSRTSSSSSSGRSSFGSGRSSFGSSRSSGGGRRR